MADGGKRRVRAGVGVVASPLMPGARVREDGWTAARTQTFLALLAQTGCVSDAARVAGISRNSVRRARAKFRLFDQACRDALAKALRGLEAVAYDRAVAGRETIIIRKGQEVERRIAPSDALLKLLIQRGDMQGLGPASGGAGPVDSQGRPLTPDDYITREEGAAGYHWWEGRKCTEDEDPRVILAKKIDQMRDRISEKEWAEQCCRRCHQPMTEAVWAEILRRGGGTDRYGGYGAVPPSARRHG